MNTIIVNNVNTWAVPGYAVNPNAYGVLSITTTYDGTQLSVGTIVTERILLGNGIDTIDTQASKGGIAINNTATEGPVFAPAAYQITYKVPNQSSPIADYAVVLDTNYLLGSIVRAVSDANIVVSGVYAAPTNIHLVTSHLGRPKKVTVTCLGTFYISTLNQPAVLFNAGTYVFGDGTSELEPIVVNYDATDIFVVWE